ncbi:phage tail protein [Escherichia coli]|uniref:phage tail protein n=3 Tax=Escherichia coli TaxID=562 RepID=UPI00209B023A|nr:phage tail protein [Escherichia coli]MCO7744700.1 phage tail protein [Escherichia coli]MCO7770209.1 phage tail protein [Escherichia coli]MCO7775126.1 phage tail protein [Escherichia coli]MCO7780048.1 phage tail protein [Escherichia coli]
MSTKFYTLLTDIGAAKLASAAALGVPLKITHMAVGDGGGVLPTPDAKQTALVNEKRRAALNMLYIDPQNRSQIIAEQVIPENEGGWWIREVGLFDESGALIAVGNCPESYKPQLAEGSGRTQTVRMVLITSSTDNITLKIDPAVVLATRKYVDDKALELKVYADDQMAKHLAAPDPHSQYAPKASPTFTGTPKAPTPAAGNNTTQVATTAFVQAALTALINGAPATLDTLKEIAAAINNDPNFSTTINNALALKAPLSSPALTGTPTAPTAAQSVNNTQIATTAFVKSAIAGMVGSAPAALDTLNELAAALGNDPNFATTMLNALAGKQPLDNTLTNLSGKDVAGLLKYLGLGASAFGLKNVVYYTSAQVVQWPVPDILKQGRRCYVVVIGGGASGAYGNEKAGGTGGSSGGRSEKIVDLTGVDEVTVTVGAGGAAIDSNNSAGNPGATSSFGTYLSATGAPATNIFSSQPGGKGIGGDVNIAGFPGTPAVVCSTDGKRTGGNGGGPGAGAGKYDTAQQGAEYERNARFPGSGGAGLAYYSGLTGSTGRGADGAVYIYW